LIWASAIGLLRPEMWYGFRQPPAASQKSLSFCSSQGKNEISVQELVEMNGGGFDRSLLKEKNRFWTLQTSQNRFGRSGQSK